MKGEQKCHVYILWSSHGRFFYDHRVILIKAICRVSKWNHQKASDFVLALSSSEQTCSALVKNMQLLITKLQYETVKTLLCTRLPVSFEQKQEQTLFLRHSASPVNWFSIVLEKQKHQTDRNMKHAAQKYTVCLYNRI